MSIQDLACQIPLHHEIGLATKIPARVNGMRNSVMRESFSVSDDVSRFERVGSVNGVEFLNDSKAANINTAWYALELMHGPIIWIMGGQDKGNDYTHLYDLVKAKVKAIVYLGQNCTKARVNFSELVSYFEETDNVKDAVGFAQGFASSGDTVLISPAALSFHLFEQREDRSWNFKKVIEALM